MTTIRASFVLPAALHQRLLIASKQENKNLSEVVREILDRELAKREQSRLDQVYQGIREMSGIGDPGITDASTTIDEVLYGENGAWRGSSDE